MIAAMIIDAHTHLFSLKVIANVARREVLADALSLETEKAARRHRLEQLEQESRAAGVEACLLLPTAAAPEVASVNQKFIDCTKTNRFFFTAGTLHPHHKDNLAGLALFDRHDIRAVKLCSFSQGFSLDHDETFALFDLIQKHGAKREKPFVVVLDTFFKADFFFGSPEINLTTPERLGRLVRRYGGIVFVAAHMGGLCAPFEEIIRHLQPCPNLYLGTSNAAHTLAENEFVELLTLHGPERILFGTDWPWFGHAEEIPRIRNLLEKAGFSRHDRERVFAGNIAKLLRLPF